MLQNDEFTISSLTHSAIKDRYTVAFEGEIYNKAECLKGVPCPLLLEYVTNEELIATLYDRFQGGLVSQLRGMFSFVLWDRQEKALFAARDPFGMQHLFYKQSDDDFFFSTSKTSLHLKDKSPTICETALQHYFSFQYVPEQHSMYDGIHTLPPGHTLKISDGNISLQQYNKLTFRPITKSADAFTKATRQILEYSIKMQLKHAPSAGAFLSGGIDSTSIVAIAKQFNPNIKTFTVGFNEQGFSEIELAKATASELNVANVHKIITAEECISQLPTIIQHLDEPIADPAAIPLYFAAKEARKHVDVVLSGEGADELFGGYSIYREPFALRWFHYLPEALKKRLHELSIKLPEGMKGKSYLWRGTTPLEERYIGNANIFSEAEKKLILSHYDDTISFTDITKELFTEAKAYDDSMKMQYIDLHTWLSGDILANANRIAAAHSLQFRYPFLDKDLFNLARQIPTKAKFKKRTTKYVLRKAMEDIVPRSALYRKKLGFPVPIRHWLREEMYDWAKSTIETSETTHLLDKQAALALLDAHATSKYDYSRKLWTILVFMIWYSLQTEETKELAGSFVSE